MSTRAAPPVKLLRAREVAVQMGISESQVWALVRSGELESIKIGWSRRIPADAVDKYIKRRLDDEKAAAS
jgi:excisionase family DNA binding protein